MPQSGVQVFANLGDSRALLSSGKQLAFATRDHKPTDQLEKDRICEAGGFVLRGRVCAALAVSRALGDHQFKDSRLPQAEQMVSPVPDITFVDRNLLTDDFLLVCTSSSFLFSVAIGLLCAPCVVARGLRITPRGIAACSRDGRVSLRPPRACMARQVVHVHSAH